MKPRLPGPRGVLIGQKMTRLLPDISRDCVISHPSSLHSIPFPSSTQQVLINIRMAETQTLMSLPLARLIGRFEARVYQLIHGLVRIETLFVNDQTQTFFAL